jgi:hypothetical protein
MTDRNRTGSALEREVRNNAGRTAGGLLHAACVTALSIAFAVATPLLAHDEDDRMEPPPVPSNIEVPEGNEAFLVGRAVGTQNYVCLPSGSGVAWVLFTPQATLFTERGRQIQTHFFSPNRFENGTVRATWQDSRDTSAVWGMAGASSSDPAFVAPNAIPWLRVDVVGTEEGPRGGDKLTGTTFIQRLNTAGGRAPSTGCALATDVGNRAYVPYAADYYFFRKDRRGRR